eukprot:4872770-Pleurochrysis_carterae.AAC.1
MTRQRASHKRCAALALSSAPPASAFAPPTPGTRAGLTSSPPPERMHSPTRHFLPATPPLRV